MPNTPAHPEPQTDEEPGPPPATADFIDAAPADEPAFPPAAAFQDDLGATSEIPAVSDMSDATQQIPPVSLDPAPVWHQPEPTEPFHARHEKPGEWQYEPPEHLSLHHSPPAEVQDPTHLIHAVPAPAWEVPLLGGTEDADRRRRGGLWISVALTTTLLLCGGGAASAYLLLRDSDAKGAPDPATAVDEFMTAVYTRQDPAAAGELVCREARDKDKLAARVQQIKGYTAEYDQPSFKWADPSVNNQNDDRATVSVQLTMQTDDEKTAQQELTFTTIRKSGWLVCEISG